MKKLLIILALVLAVSVAFVACNREETPDTPATEAPTTGAPVEDNDNDATTEAPTTEAPTTEAPTTEKPTDDNTDDLPGDDNTDDLPGDDNQGGNTGDDNQGGNQGGNTGDDNQGGNQGGNTGDDNQGGNQSGNTGDDNQGGNQGGNTGDDNQGGNQGGNTGDDNQGGNTPPVEETIPYIGVITSVNGLGPDGKKWSAANGYHTNPPSTANPVQFAPPVVGDAWDYTCRSFKVEGWAMLQGGQGALVWSDDLGETWKEIADVTYADGAGGMTDPQAWMDIAGITRFNDWDLSFSATIDLSDYEDDEEVTIWIGRKTVDGSAAQAIFKFNAVVIGDEAHVAELCEVCGNFDLADTYCPVSVVDFSLVESSMGIADVNGRTDRIQGNGKKADGSTCNLGNAIGWNREVKLLQKDIVEGHYFQIEGWLRLAEEGKNYELSINVMRGTEILWSKNTTDHYTGSTNYKAEVTCFKYCSNSFRSDIYQFNNNNPCAFYSARLYTANLQKGMNDGINLETGDTVHITLKDKDTGHVFCVNKFTLKIVPDNTDLTVNVG